MSQLGQTFKTGHAIASQRNDALCPLTIDMRHSAPQQNNRLFDHLVGQGHQFVRNFEAQSFGGRDVDHQLEACRLNDG